MTRYNKFKSLNHVRDEYILESMPDHLGLKKRHSESPIARFFNSSWGAACVCTVVALAVMIFIIRAGQDPFTPPAGTPSHPSESETMTEPIPPETETEIESQPYFDPSTLALDSYQGMTADIPYTITYSSNGDGTCMVSAITVNILYEGEYTVEIPQTSPSGDKVIGISLVPTYNLPAYIMEKDFEKIKNALLEYYRDTPNQPDDEVKENFWYKWFMSYFQLKGMQYCTTPELEADLLSAYPLCGYADMYVLDPTITPEERTDLTRIITAIAPWYTPEWCYADLLNVKALADEQGVTDAYLEVSLAIHSDHLRDAVTVTLPWKLKIIDEKTPEILASMGINSLTYDGTMEMFFEISDIESSAVRSPLVVHCIDGDISYPVRN